jgi:hypothetical protein
MGCTHAYEYRIARSVRWKCASCGEYMLALVWEDSTGRFVFEDRPLACPRCTTLRGFFGVLAELGGAARSTTEFMRLVAQLLERVAAEHASCN